jgi:hypothetical protein
VYCPVIKSVLKLSTLKSSTSNALALTIAAIVGYNQGRFEMDEDITDEQ